MLDGSGAQHPASALACSPMHVSENEGGGGSFAGTGGAGANRSGSQCAAGKSGASGAQVAHDSSKLLKQVLSIGSTETSWVAKLRPKPRLDAPSPAGQGEAAVAESQPPPSSVQTRAAQMGEGLSLAASRSNDGGKRGKEVHDGCGVAGVRADLPGTACMRAALGDGVRPTAASAIRQQASDFKPWLQHGFLVRGAADADVVDLTFTDHPVHPLPPNSSRGSDPLVQGKGGLGDAMAKLGAPGCPRWCQTVAQGSSEVPGARQPREDEGPCAPGGGDESRDAQADGEILSPNDQVRLHLASLQRLKTQA